jgi:hypothetical protein
MSIFALTLTGKSIHISDDLIRTRCGYLVSGVPEPDDVLYFGVCLRCRGRGY